MWSLISFQQINKLDAMDGGSDRCEHGSIYCYGLVYECCVANHTQGWPKFGHHHHHHSSSSSSSRVEGGHRKVQQVHLRLRSLCSNISAALP